MNMIIGALLAGSVLLAISLQRTYGHLPLKELKHRARAGDQTAALLHQAAAYGSSLRAVLWTLILVSAGSFFVFIADHLSGLLAIACSAGLLFAGFVWLPKRQVNDLSLWFAVTLAPVFAWVMHYLHGPVDWLVRSIRRSGPAAAHTGLYDKEDLLELINDQNLQPDNRIEQHRLEMAFHTLTFGDKPVGDHLTPRRAVKAVSIDDTIGPIMMDELHASGFSRFPVYDGKKDNIVGVLFLKDLVRTKASAKVKDVMHRQVCYVHEDQSLQDALQAILKTHQQLFIVVNSFEEYVGVISIEDIFEAIIGQPIVDEFDQYYDLRAVAARAAEKDHEDHVEAEPPVTTEAEVVE